MENNRNDVKIPGAGLSKRMAALLCMVCISLGGCGTMADTEGGDVFVERKQEESPYILKEVTRTDVLLTETIRCKYQEADSTDVLFEESNREVIAVHVKKGDVVEKGQLLFELEGARQSDEVEELEYEIARNKLLLSFLDVNENFDRSEQWWNYAYKQNGSEEAEERLQSTLAGMERSYNYKREDYEDAISVAEKRLKEIQGQMVSGKVYSPKDGRVKEISADLVGTISQKGEVALTLVANSLSVFEVGGVSRADYFPEGVPIPMKLGSGKNAVDLEVIPYDRENWKSKMYFTLVASDENPLIRKGDAGTITLELDRRENVLALSKQVIHESGDRSYVYVLGENDIREIRWIEIGLQGNNLVEIVSGLSEGESVILR